MTIETLPFETIKQLYPNEWVLLGDPELDNADTLGSIVSKLMSGVVLFHSQDKREVAYKSAEYRKGFSTYTCVFTGEIPKGRKCWL